MKAITVLGIKQKFIGAVASLLSVVALFVFIFFPSKQEQLLKKQLADKAIVMVQMLADQTAAPLLFGDTEAVQSALQTLDHIDDVTFALILKNDGEVFEDYQGASGAPYADRIQEALARKEDGLIERDDLWLAVKPIVYADEQAGTMVLGISLRNLETSVANSRWITLLISLAILSLGSLAFSWLVVRLVRPIKHLEAAAREVARGNLEVSVEARTKDEVGSLSQSFNVMVASINKAHRELHALANTLGNKENKIRVILESAAEGIVATDQEGIITEANRAASNIFSYSGEALIGRPISVLFPCLNHRAEKASNNANASLTPVIEQVLGTGYECQGQRKGGALFPAELSVGEVSQDYHKAFTWVVRDISRRKQAEAQVQRLNERLIEASRQAGIAEIATSVLHNVGNVLNSVNTSAALIANTVRRSKISGLIKATELMQ